MLGWYDAVILDVDNKALSCGISSPPPAFIASEFLCSAHCLLNSHGQNFCQCTVFDVIALIPWRAKLTGAWHFSFRKISLDVCIEILHSQLDVMNKFSEVFYNVLMQ